MGEVSSYLGEIEDRCKAMKVPRGNLNFWMDLYFKTYRRERHRVRTNPSYVSTATREEIGDLLYGTLTSKNLDNGAKGVKALREMFRTDWFQDELDGALIEIESFSEFGETYCNILRDVFIAERPSSAKEMCDKLMLAHTTYYRRREESLKLFASVIWEKCVDGLDREPERLEYLAKM